MSVLTYCSLPFRIGTSSIWQASHTQTRRTHTRTRVWLSVICRWVLGFPSSAVVSCRNRKLLYIRRDMCSRLPLDPGHGDSLISLTMPACHAKCLVERDIQRLGGYLPPWGRLSNHALGVRWLSCLGKVLVWWKIYWKMLPWWHLYKG